MVGLRVLFEEEQSLRLRVLEAHTCKAFMAAFRVGQRLVFTYVGGLRRELRVLFVE